MILAPFGGGERGCSDRSSQKRRRNLTGGLCRSTNDTLDIWKTPRAVVFPSTLLIRYRGELPALDLLFSLSDKR